tara:strand:- start:394 stop:1206 length:813 start_codon:yes stop_codon:yes gene_type:complete
MKKYLLIIIGLLLYSCEDVIDVDLNTIEPKLVIDASLNWFKETAGNQQEIKLTLTAPYFDNEIQPATGAQVKVTKNGNDVFTFEEQDQTGIYINNTFIPQINETYNLDIIYQNQRYTATEKLISVVDIDYVEQNDEGGFSGDETELKAFYTDPANEENYYFFEFINDIPDVPSLEIYDDQFTDGNQIFGFFTEEELESGDIVTIRNYGVSERFYEFMFILLQQNSTDGGGPFETQPATVRGNCINITNPDNFPLGYFRVSEASELIYTVE